MNYLIDFFPRLLNMSVVASIVILFVLAARLVLKRAPKIFSYALWAIVLIRLLIPVSIQSPVSVIPVRLPAATDREEVPQMVCDHSCMLCCITRH